MPIVDYILIGSMKCGTTTVVDYLSLNKGISICSIKEPQFFSRNYNKGIEYYESLWLDGNKVCGEASTCYSRWPVYGEVPERISSYNPRMKLIFIMRDPVERAYSHFRHNVLIDRLDYKSFSDALDKSNEIRLTSMYMTQIEQYLKFFPKEQLLLLDFDDLTQDPVKTINIIERFLGVGESTPADLSHLKSNQAGMGAVRRNVRQSLHKIRSLPIINDVIDFVFSKQQREMIRLGIMTRLEKSKLLKLYGKMKANKLKIISDDEKENFRSSIMSDIDSLEVFWQKDLSKWK